MSSLFLSLLLIGSVLPAGEVSAATVVSTVDRPPSIDASTRVSFPEVRIRRLHLVRPDLIPFPLLYEVHC